MNWLIEQRLALVAEIARAQNVRIEFDNKIESAETIADKARLTQVFDNLLRNALEAMPTGGELKVALEKDAHLIRLQLSDSGAGFTLAAQERTFEPFFTTKDTGTGLGLTVSRETIEAHNGELYLLPNADKGAGFVVELPIK